MRSSASTWTGNRTSSASTKRHLPDKPHSPPKRGCSSLPSGFGVAVYSGQVGACFWTCVIGAFSDEEAEAFAEGIRRLGELTRSQDVVELDICHDIPLPKPMHRKLLADAVAAIPDTSHVVGHALVSNSTVAQGVMTAINWFVKPAFPEKVFRDPRSGLAWLSAQLPSVNPRRVLDAIVQDVPDFERLRWK